MPKKKKKAFIDKRNAHTFAVVHRAARDPLAQDPSAPQHVLQPTYTGNDRKRYLQQQRKQAAVGGTVVELQQDTWDKLREAGAFGDAAEREEMYSKQEWELATYGLPTDDGYDYAQHLRTMGGGAYTGAKHDPVVAQVIAKVEQEEKKNEPQKMILLPEAALPSEVYHTHLLDTAEYELDPEVWAAMEAAENETADDEGWEPLEEDFIELANMSDAEEDDDEAHDADRAARHRAGPEYDGDGDGDEHFEEYEEASEEQMYHAIFAWADEDEDGLLSREEFNRLQCSCSNETPDAEQWALMCGALGCSPEEGLTEPALIKLYEGEGPYGDYYTLVEKRLIEDSSLTNQRSPRQQTGGVYAGTTTDRGESRLLDEQFDKVARDYDDSDIGSLDGSDEDAHGQYDLSEFGDVLDEFIANEDGQPLVNRKSKKEEEYLDLDVKAHVLARFGDDAPDLPPDSDLQEPKSARDAMDGWDVETIVSTYSNTENHPGVISYAKTGKKSARRQAREAREAAEAADREARAAGADTGDISLSRHGLPVEYYEKLKGAVGTVPEGEEAEDDDDEFSDEYDDDQSQLPENKGVARPRHGKESKEDKKARKQAVKMERQLARKAKKGLKVAYRKEEMAQEKSMNAGSASYGRTVLSLS